MISVDEDNFFDVAEAIHAFCALNHTGQNSVLYSILSQSDFNPSPNWSETRVESENQHYIELTEQNIESIFDQLKAFHQ